jgi:hypothetical protein
MDSPRPLYTSENCKCAYQLNWAVSLFWREPIDGCEWLPWLKAATEPDGVRVLKHTLIRPNVSQFLVSTRPEVMPGRLLWSVKGRLQHLVKHRYPKAFRRNYGLRSVGSASREAVEKYVQGQADHHPMADSRVQAVLREV